MLRRVSDPPRCRRLAGSSIVSSPPDPPRSRPPYRLPPALGPLQPHSSLSASCPGRRWLRRFGPSTRRFHRRRSTPPQHDQDRRDHLESQIDARPSDCYQAWTSHSTVNTRPGGRCRRSRLGTRPTDRRIRGEARRRRGPPRSNRPRHNSRRPRRPSDG
jgi:hypothetical protein